MWKESTFWVVLKKCKKMTFVDCCMAVWTECGRELLDNFVVICWAVWQEYCKRSHDQDKAKDPIQAYWAVALLEEIQNSCSRGMGRKLDTLHSDKVWKRPKHNQIRLDVDAGIDDSKHTVSVGIVVRDTRGVVIGAKSCLIHNPGSIKGAEAAAIRTGMEFCLHNGFQNVFIFSDSLLAVQAINNREVDLTHVGSIILDIYDLFESKIFISLVHMRRTANVLAHQLARLALSSHSCYVWLEDSVPNWIFVIASHDLRS